jgi:zinc/manganese transport system ATP-binding protein
MPQLRFHNLTLGYERHPAVHHLTGAVEAGALLAVVGPNGAGKSTLFKGIIGALKPLSGSIERDGHEAHQIAYLPQAADIDRSFPINLYDMVAMGLLRSRGAFGGITAKDHHVIEHAIAAVGLTGFEQRAIGTLSGGQMQRMLFARLLIQDAQVIVLDEPFAAIDDRTASDLLRLVQRWHDEGRTVVAALHDIDLIKANFPDTLMLAREPVAWGATAKVLTPDNLAKARLMCEPFDDSAEACAMREVA